MKDKDADSSPMEITSEIAAKCNGPDQFSKFDRLVRNVLAIPPKAKEATRNGRAKKRVGKKRG